ncbi:hypothetical protein AAC691_17380 [Nguyenibacter vanlangensis]|uniref:Uncharacterized protein n=1 Tax=Nguyenibacter vanlangensis TaxID=1216886 RepID=A0ABZ3D348_9PROT
MALMVPGEAKPTPTPLASRSRTLAAMGERGELACIRWCDDSSARKKGGHHMSMLEVIRKDRLPCLHSGSDEKLENSVLKAAQKVEKTATFDKAAMLDLEKNGPTKNFRLPVFDAPIYLELWAHDAADNEYALGVMYHDLRFVITFGRGWPGSNPAIIPVIFEILPDADGHDVTINIISGKTTTDRDLNLGKSAALACLLALDAYARKEEENVNA